MAGDAFGYLVVEWKGLEGGYVFAYNVSWQVPRMLFDSGGARHACPQTGHGRVDHDAVEHPCCCVRGGIHWSRGWLGDGPRPQCVVRRSTAGGRNPHRLVEPYQRTALPVSAP